jgi:thiamine biosynthesis lipoprotein
MIQKFLFLVLSGISLTGCICTPGYVYNEGSIYGTVYHIVYESPDGDDLHDQIKEKLDRLNRIFSTFDTSSVISGINNNKPVEPGPEFLFCFERAMEISGITGGAFDITAGSMVNAWGFGPEEKKRMTPDIIDSLKRITGYKKIAFTDGKIKKELPDIKIDMSAIAKGYTCDIVGGWLNEKGCENYMVEIGGEVVAKGRNEKGRIWTIGISKPDENSFFATTELQARVRLPERALATSGNYRNFYVEDGKKFAHTIDPKTGYPVQHNLLSATVMAPSCIDADAFATAFMVLGLDESVRISREIPGFDVYFIYSADEGKTEVYMSDNFKELLVD